MTAGTLARFVVQAKLRKRTVTQTGTADTVKTAVVGG